MPSSLRLDSVPRVSLGVWCKPTPQTPVPTAQPGAAPTFSCCEHTSADLMGTEKIRHLRPCFNYWCGRFVCFKHTARRLRALCSLSLTFVGHDIIQSSCLGCRERNHISRGKTWFPKHQRSEPLRSWESVSTKPKRIVIWNEYEM